MTSFTKKDFEALVLGSAPVAREHANVVPGYLSAAWAAAAVHTDGARRASAAGYLSSGGPSREAVMLLSCHTFNLFVELVSCVYAGRFDTACYLTRPAWDASALLRYVGSDESVAEAFLSDPSAVKASSARIANVDRLRQLDAAAGEEVNRIFKDDFAAANTLSHVNITQLGKLVERTGPNSRRATVGGRPDTQEAIAMLRLAGYCESMTLSALREVGGFGKQWDDRAVRALDKVMAWSKSAQAGPVE